MLHQAKTGDSIRIEVGNQSLTIPVDLIFSVDRVLNGIRERGERLNVFRFQEHWHANTDTLGGYGPSPIQAIGAME